MPQTADVKCSLLKCSLLDATPVLPMRLWQTRNSAPLLSSGPSCFGPMTWTWSPSTNFIVAWPVCKNVKRHSWAFKCTSVRLSILRSVRRSRSPVQYGDVTSCADSIAGVATSDSFHALIIYIYIYIYIYTSICDSAVYLLCCVFSRLRHEHADLYAESFVEVPLPPGQNFCRRIANAQFITVWKALVLKAMET